MDNQDSVGLRAYTTRGGCAAKWAPGELETILKDLKPSPADSTGAAQNSDVLTNLLLGYNTSDDAAVYRLSDNLAAVLTADFFTPMVDDPYEFGCIAATNALSDIYAMGAKPLVALNLLAFPPKLGSAAAAAVLQGGADTTARAGAVIAGGHTIEDDEPKYGLSVFGSVDPKHIISNAGAKPGDVLFYTKPLGTGIMMSALTAGLETRGSLDAVIDAMCSLNDQAAQAMLAADVHAATDVTGFSLVGHLHELLAASGCAARINVNTLPLFDRVWDYSAAMCRPGRSFDIINWIEPWLTNDGISAADWEIWLGVICDPQTSGGLLVSIPADKAGRFDAVYRELSGKAAWRIGSVTAGKTGTIELYAH